MAHPYHHAVSSQRKWGGEVEDYLPIHAWFDETKAHHGDFRHRALRHHAEGIFLMESIFGTTITVHLTKACPCGCVRFDREHRTCEDCGRAQSTKKIPTRWIGEQHVTEDLGRIPAATEWLSAIAPAPWMNRSRALSREQEREEAHA